MSDFWTPAVYSIFARNTSKEYPRPRRCMARMRLLASSGIGIGYRLVIISKNFRPPVTHRRRERSKKLLNISRESFNPLLLMYREKCLFGLMGFP